MSNNERKKDMYWYRLLYNLLISKWVMCDYVKKYMKRLIRIKFIRISGYPTNSINKAHDGCKYKRD